VGGLRRHAASTTARAEAAAFAGKRHEALEGAALAPHAGEAASEDAARQELPELTLDEAGKSAAVGAVGGLAQEGFEVIANDAVEEGALGVPGLIRSATHDRRASEARAARRSALLLGTGRQTATRIWNAASR